MGKIKPLRIAIFDLTDCEGCELEFLALRKKLVDRGHDFEITNWRLANHTNSTGPFDVTFIEGSPITSRDIDVVKQARKVSKTIVTLGTCASCGGIQSALPESDRDKNLSSVYDSKYKTNSKSPKPVSYYIGVDIHLAGCPINPKELERLLTCLFVGKEFKQAYAPVCLDCKAAGNPCLFLDEGFCLGPVTKGGCGAPCPQKGLRCYGCFGPMPGANLSALRTAGQKNLSDQKIENAIRLFFAQSDEYKEYKIRRKK
jgi:coenzyme F420-reducing hydrogenase gamma subunit